MSNQWGGGFIPIIYYSGGSAIAHTSFHLITQSNIDITTQDLKNILVQVP